MDEKDHGLSRRDLLAAIPAASALAGLTSAVGADAAVIAPARTTRTIGGKRLTFVDLTHRLTEQFSFSPQTRRIALEPIAGSGEAVGMRLNRLQLVEHTGTHIDAPSHFAAEAPSLGEIPLPELVVPLAVLDLRQRAKSDRDAMVMPRDILAWEARHGRLPDDCCVALDSGWDPLAEFARQDLPPKRKRLHPGFGPEVAEMLIRNRRVRGVALDAMSLDTGANGPAYPFHQRWLRSGRWGIEGLTNLSAVPASGALLIVGAAPIAGATGMPVRAIALF